MKHMLQRYPYFDKKKASAALSWLPFGKAKTSESRCAWSVHSATTLRPLASSVCAAAKHRRRAPPFNGGLGAEMGGWGAAGVGRSTSPRTSTCCSRTWSAKASVNLRSTKAPET